MSAAEQEPMARSVKIFYLVAGIAVVVGLIIGVMQKKPHDCHWDYQHTYLDRGGPYDEGEKLYCENWQKGQDFVNNSR